MKDLETILWISLVTLGLLASPIDLVRGTEAKEQNNNNDPRETPASNSTNNNVETGRRLELTLKNAIDLALENNRSVKIAYLDRIIARQDLAQNTAIYVPRLTPTAELLLGRNSVLSGETITNFGDINFISDLSILIPTGGEFSIIWAGGGQLETTDTLGFFSNQNALDRSLTITFTQPLLRGFGPSITNIPIFRAELNEEESILTLKRRLIETVTETITTYRELVRAQEALEIEQQALDRAREQLEITRAFIEAGRRARVDIIQNETQIAQQELALLRAENALINARSNLIQILDLERDFMIIATETPKREAISLAEPLDLQELLKLAFANDIDYLNALIAVDSSRLNLKENQDLNRWDLDLELEYINSLDGLRSDIGDSNLSVSLNLSKELFGPRTSARDVIRSEVELERRLISLEEAKESLTIEVENSIRRVNFALQEARQARLARELAERQLEIEREKQRLGAGDLFQLINFENSLVQAQQQELNAIIEYLNSLTELQQTIGITLDIWEIQLEQ